MKDLFRNIKSDKTTKLAFSISILLIIFISIFALFIFGRLPPYIPIFNQLPWGEDRLGLPITIFIPILAAFSIFIVNFAMAELVYSKIPLVSRMLAGTSILISTLTFLFVIKTVILIL